MTPTASRLKDVLWSIRRRFGMETDIDRLFPLFVFDRKWTREQVEDLFITYPKRTPEEFRAALVAYIRQTIRHYWQFDQTRKGYHKVLKGVKFLENVVRCGSEGCRLVEDKFGSFCLELR